MDQLLRGGVRAAAVLTTYDMMQDPTLWGPETFADLALSDGTLVKSVVWPVKFSNFNKGLAVAPSVGQHTQEVLGGLLKYSDAEIVALRASRRANSAVDVYLKTGSSRMRQMPFERAEVDNTR